MTTAYERILDRLHEHGSKVRPRGDRQAVAQCPAHEDRSPSLSVRAGGRGALVYCHAGCQTADVMAAIGLSMDDLFDTPREVRYEYPDANGRVLRTVLRRPGKDFSQSIRDRSTVPLYRLPELAAAVTAGHPVWLCEGERDVDNLAALAGVVATTAPMGAGNFDKVDVEPLRGADVVAVVDRDAPGDKWAAAVVERVGPVAASLHFVRAAVGKDASDHLAAGLGLDELEPYQAPTASSEPEDADHEANPLRRARVTWASSIEPEPVIWAWQDDDGGRIPAGSLSLAAGREGTGKSSFGIWACAHVTRGTLPGSWHGTARRTLYVAVEDSWRHTLVPRLMAAGADLGAVGRFDVVNLDDDELTLSLPADLGLLEAAIREHDVALVVIDPLMSTMGDKIDTHREREVRSALDPLARLADRTGAVVLGIAHFNKGNGTDAASLITGSGAFKNVPRSVFGFARDDTSDDGGRVMSQVKNSLGRDDLPSLSYVISTAEVPTRHGVALTGRFTFTGTSDKSVADVLRESHRSGDPDENSERDEAAEWLVDYLTSRGGDSTAAEAIKAGTAVGISKTTLTRARQKAGVKSVKSGFGGGWVWQLDAPRIHEESEESREQKPGFFGPFADSSPTPADDEESTKGAKSAGNGSLLPSLPSLHSALPSAQEPTEAAQVAQTGHATPPPEPDALFGVSPAPEPAPAHQPVDVRQLLARTPETTTCPECGDPLDGPGLLTRCRPNHAERKSA